MFNKELAKKIDNFIKEKFPMIYEFDFDGIVFLFGGTTRNLIMGATVKDLDFVILTQGECQIKKFIKKYKLNYTLNALGGYKINYNNFIVDIFSTDDLLDAVRYNIDALFYDIHKGFFISCGAIKAIENAEIIEINSDTKPLYCDIARTKKLIRFVKFLNLNNKKVKVRENKFLWSYKMIFEFVKKILKK